jgi:hypothetical protein
MNKAARLGVNAESQELVAFRDARERVATVLSEAAAIQRASAALLGWLPPARAR